MATVLIVDDSLIMRRNLSTILKEAGHTVVGEAVNGQQAYLLYRRLRPDLVTMDITMPNVDGIDALKKILESHPEAKVIMISALDQKAKIYTAIRNGAKHYIIKPLTAEKIVSVIDKVLESPEKEVIIKEQADQPPFEINNEAGSFEVNISRDLEFKDVIVLDHAIQGFLYIKDVQINFDFDIYELAGEEALTKFEAMLNKIRMANGKFKIIVKKPDFSVRLMLKDGELKKAFDAGEYVLE